MDVVHGQKAQDFSYLFRASCVCIFFSFAAIEAFLNQTLPEHKLIDYKGKQVGKKTLEKATFEEKISTIIPSILKKDFADSNKNDYEVILKLKNLRNRLVHLKQIRNGLTSYNDIYQDILNANYNEIVATTKNFLNFHHSGLIENYPLEK
ncbi:hypothetical protein [Flavobacterium caeni]|uniref:hypothetical protein n=1 Tax=Flavobacterium caeni TaxID=490189 RepID=UPI001113133D|nr:hypothetical protein [Flavobacterium caeni]